MISADRPGSQPARLLTIGANGKISHAARTNLAALLRPGDLVVANDAATLPASLTGRFAATGAPIELRLAAWVSLGDATRFVAVLFGAGDHRTRTEDRPSPPRLAPGDTLALGPLLATVERILDHPRLISVRFAGTSASAWAGIARHGRPIQYAHVPKPLALWDTWTKIAAHPIAFEPPSAGFSLDWQMLAAFRKHGIGFATLSLAAGLSSTGDPALDRKFPLDEPFRIPEKTTAAILRTKAAGGRIIAIGTTVVRALEAAALGNGAVQAGNGIATGRIGPKTRLRVVDAILSGVHAPGESHFELLRAFTDDAALSDMATALAAHRYRNHEFGDSVLIERRTRALSRKAPASCVGRSARTPECEAAMAL